MSGHGHPPSRSLNCGQEKWTWLPIEVGVLIVVRRIQVQKGVQQENDCGGELEKVSTRRAGLAEGSSYKKDDAGSSGAEEQRRDLGRTAGGHSDAQVAPEWPSGSFVS